jgi:DNA-binding HxlR family transcriptional regulator
MIVLALASGGMRLTNLHHRLPGVSTGVLERYIQRMVVLGLLTRTRFKEMPPRVELELTDAGRELVPVAGALARWAMRHNWSPPDARERVELPALLRVLPALLEERARLPAGWIEAVVAGVEPPIRYLYRVQRGHLRLVDRSEGPPDGATMVRIKGDERAWVVALGPDGDHRRLRLAGDERLARELFAALPRSPTAGRVR